MISVDTDCFGGALLMTFLCFFFKAHVAGGVEKELSSIGLKFLLDKKHGFM